MERLREEGGTHKMGEHTRWGHMHFYNRLVPKITMEIS